MRLSQLGPIPRRATPYEEFFSWSSRHHCPMEVGAYDLHQRSPARYH